MTILVCQKRHHEPHVTPIYVIDGRGISTRDEHCDGLPRWPHTRPKPPPVQDWDAYCPYMTDHGTTTVVNVGAKWLVEWVVPGPRYRSVPFPKDQWPEAINYAQKLAQERKQQNGLVEGR